MSTTFDPIPEAEELREQLASDKRRLIVFFYAFYQSPKDNLDGGKE